MAKKQNLKPTMGILIGAGISVIAINGLFNKAPSPQDAGARILSLDCPPSSGIETIDSKPVVREPAKISVLPEELENELLPWEPTESAKSGASRPDRHANLLHGKSIGGTPSNTFSNEEFDSVLANPIQFSQSATSQSAGPLKSNIRPRESTTLQAVQHIEYGKTLARRGAMSSAKQEFIAALSVLTQDYDAQTGTSGYSQSLQAGLLALKEADDFSTRESEGQISVDASSLVESHHSGVLNPYDAKGMTLSQIREAYFDFAESQILKGVGKNVISGEALHCLGRLYSLRAGSDNNKIGLVQAAIFHRAAIHCNPSDHRSTNDLGVLLSELGELNSSVDLLKQSLRIQPNPQTWDNLAKLHRRLNQNELAERAAVEHQRALENLNTGMIQWMEPPTFNAAAPPESQLVASLPGGMQANAANVANGDERNLPPNRSNEGIKPDSKKSVGDRIKSLF